MYSPDEAKTATRDPDLASYSAIYTSGALYLALAHEIHHDFFAGSRNAPVALSNLANPAARSRDTATRASVKYAMGNTTA